MRSFVKIKTSRNGKITLSFTDIGKSCLSRKFFKSLICLLMIFAKIKLSRNFPNLQYFLFSSIMTIKFFCFFFATCSYGLLETGVNNDIKRSFVQALKLLLDKC